MEQLLYKDLSYKIIGACIEVHKKLGRGFLESVYQEVLENEFSICHIPFERQKKLKLSYKDIKLKK